MPFNGGSPLAVILSKKETHKKLIVVILYITALHSSSLLAIRWSKFERAKIFLHNGDKNLCDWLEVYQIHVQRIIDVQYYRPVRVRRICLSIFFLRYDHVEINFRCVIDNPTPKYFMLSILHSLLKTDSCKCGIGIVYKLLQKRPNSSSRSLMSLKFRLQHLRGTFISLWYFSQIGVAGSFFDRRFLLDVSDC